MTIRKLYNFLGDWLKDYPEDSKIKVVCTNSVEFINGLHEITDGFLIDDSGETKLQLW
jgi:hypothetical protein